MKRCRAERLAEAVEVAERWYETESLQDLAAFEGAAAMSARRSRAWR
ncbi:hypothetical protein ACIQBJ_14185 [Kitasatospora sp. NPDC088391]